MLINYIFLILSHIEEDTTLIWTDNLLCYARDFWLYEFYFIIEIILIWVFRLESK